MEEAVKDLMKRREKEKKSDLAGSWNISDEEFKEIKTAISESWRKWDQQHTNRH